MKPLDHTIKEVDPQGEDALSLLREAAVKARALYPELHSQGGPWPGNSPTPAGGIYVIAYESSMRVGCGALRPIDTATVEVRRMFVLKSFRRSGVARKVLAALESSAAQMEYKVMRLETGNRQAPAMAFYEAYGFKRIAPFGEYASDVTSVCYEKQVAKSAGA